MKTINFSPYLDLPSLDGEVSLAPTIGMLTDSIREHLELAIGTGSDGKLIESAIYILSKHYDPDEVKWCLRSCRDPRNARAVAGELAWAPIRMVEHILASLSRLIKHGF